MDSILVSVIIPVYNVEQFLNKCVESVLSQTHKNLEIILIDDGSTDESGKKCDILEKSDKRIKVIHKSNGGLSDARNAGLNIATGEYYSFIDSDDFVTNDMIESMLTSAQTYSCEIAICNMIRYSEQNNVKPFYCPVDKEKVLTGDEKFLTLNQPSVCNKLFKADLFEGIRFPKGKYYEDTFVYHKLLYRSKNVILTGKDSYWYLARENSIVGGEQYTDRYFDFIEAVYCRMDFLLQNQVQPYAQEACLSLYAAFSNAEKYIRKSMDNEKQFKKARQEYDLAYRYLMKCKKDITVKQKIRLAMLKYFPTLHSKIY